MEQETVSLRWEGKKVAHVNGIMAEKIWSVVSDFCNIHKWLPTIDTCYRVEGTEGQPGLVRYCTSTKTKDEDETKWARERLVKIDPKERCLSYEVLENNVGFKSYVATIKVMTVDGGDVCRLEWSFVSDPIDGWKKEDLEAFVDFFLKHWANKMEMNL
ncbi:hypothetical protein N665_2357s0005 [Sinapis alba]|nr:hypothetical protein N665_2357s0005 [Sinapis alba]